MVWWPTDWLASERHTLHTCSRSEKMGFAVVSESRKKTRKIILYLIRFKDAIDWKSSLHVEKMRRNHLNFVRRIHKLLNMKMHLKYQMRLLPRTCVRVCVCVRERVMSNVAFIQLFRTRAKWSRTCDMLNRLCECNSEWNVWHVLCGATVK